MSLLLFLSIRYQVLTQFNWFFVDSDQLINWLATTDMAHGHFYTPYFYGQFYNNLLEALLSAPFVALGASVKTVVPLISNLLGAFPFLICFSYFLARKQYELALFSMVIGLVMPIEYHFISSLARGFMGGIAVALLGVLLVTNEKQLWKTVGYLLILVSLFINPNGSVLLVPLGVLWMVKNKSKLTRDRWPLLAALVGTGIVYALLLKFKATHPQYDVHSFWTLELKWRFLKDAFLHLNDRFAYVVPYFPRLGWIVLPLLLVGNFFIYQKTNKRGLLLVSIAAIGFLVVSLAINKTADGSTSVFFPYGRMFLALPLVYGLFYYLLRQNRPTSLRLMIILIVFGLVGYVAGTKRLETAQKEAIRNNTGHVQVLHISDLCIACDELKQLVNQTNSEVLVFHSKADEYNYGCKAIHPELNTLHPSYDRRSWTFDNEAFTPRQNVLVLDWNKNFPNHISSKTVEISVLENVPFPAYLLQMDSMSIYRLYTDNNLPLRPIKEK